MPFASVVSAVVEWSGALRLMDHDAAGGHSGIDGCAELGVTGSISCERQRRRHTNQSDQLVRISYYIYRSPPLVSRENRLIYEIANSRTNLRRSDIGQSEKRAQRLEAEPSKKS